MAKALHIEERTENFIKEYKKLKAIGDIPPHKDLIDILEIKSVSTISEILKKRQNIPREAWKLFKKHFNITDNSESGSMADSEEVKIKVDRDKLIAEFQKDFIRLEARVNFMLITLAEVVSKIDKKQIGIIDSEFSEGIDKESERLLRKLKKKLSEI